jgi:hypothetical protein
MIIAFGSYIQIEWGGSDMGTLGLLDWDRCVVVALNIKLAYGTGSTSR